MKKILLCLATGSANAEMTDGSISPSLLARAGTGGGNVPIIVLESNQNHAVAKETETCPTLTASMGTGGGVCADDNPARI